MNRKQAERAAERAREAIIDGINNAPDENGAINCQQCRNPNQKGIHTCDRGVWKDQSTS